MYSVIHNAEGYNVDKLDDKILDKIKKCLALSQSSEPHEAAAALRQAQKLMEKYDITQSDLGRSEIVMVDFKSKFSVSKLKDYEVSLVTLVAKAFGCKVMWVKSSSHAVNVFGTFTLIGLKAQVPIAHYTCEVLQRKMARARAQFIARFGGHCGRTRKTVEADGFCKGWVREISKTVHEFALSDETKVFIEDEFQRLTSGRTADSQKRKIGAVGYHAGRAAASGESIHRPMGETKHKFLSE
jgi:hypothetical protein